VTASSFDVLREEEGQGLVEYALMLVLVAAAVVAGLTVFGVAVNNLYAWITHNWPQ